MCTIEYAHSYTPPAWVKDPFFHQIFSSNNMSASITHELLCVIGSFSFQYNRMGSNIQTQVKRVVKKTFLNIFLIFVHNMQQFWKKKTYMLKQNFNLQ